MRATSASRRRLQLTTAGVWDWDVEHDLTNHTDGYYRVFGVDPAFGRANVPHLAAAARHRPGQRNREHSATAPHVDPERQGARDRVSLPSHRRQLALGAGPRLRRGSRARRRDPARAGPGGGHHGAQDPRDGVVGGRPALPRRGARIALRGLRDRRRDRRCPRARARAGARLRRRPSCRGRRTGPRWCIRTTSRCSGSGSTAMPSRWPRLQYRIRHRDGHYITLLDSPCVVRDAAGQGGAHRRCGASTSASRRAPRRRCAQSQEMLQMVAAGTGDWLILVDTERRVQFINRGIRAHSRESIIGQRIDETRGTGGSAKHSSPRSSACSTPASPWTSQLAHVGRAVRRPQSSTRASARFVRRGHQRRGDQHHRDHRPPGGARSCARRRRACSSCCTKAWWSSTPTT